MKDIESQLRTTLDEQATRAPAGDELAMRILAEVQGSGRVLRPRRGWSTWTMPLLAAGAVAAVVATVVGVGQLRHEVALTPTPPARTHVPSASGTQTTPKTPSPTQASAVQAVQPSNPTSPIGLTRFQAIDTTFIGTEDGWALGTADCLNGSGQPCAAMVYTTDGGRNWRSMKQPPGNVALRACAAPCFEHIRFATDLIGYAFSSDTLYLTRDGGQSWVDQKAGADALETLDGNVIRVSLDRAGCSGPCPMHIYTAPIGSSTWTAAALPARSTSTGVDLLRQGGEAVVLSNQVLGHAGAIPGQVLLTSSDDGHSWVQRADPCRTVGTQAVGATVGARTLAMGIDGSLSVLCTGGGVTGDTPVIVTAPTASGGFAATAPLTMASDGPPIADIGALSVKTLFVAGGSGLYRSDDRGSSWRLVLPVPAADGTYLFGPGFENGNTGRWLTAAGRTIWTTRDGGSRWTGFDFS